MFGSVCFPVSSLARNLSVNAQKDAVCAQDLAADTQPVQMCRNDSFLLLYGYYYYYDVVGFFYPHAAAGDELGVVLLTVHRREGVCLAVNIHWIAKERQIIN